jgi:transmembrane sensor
MTRKTLLTLLKKYNEGKASKTEKDIINRYYELFDALPNEVNEKDLDTKNEMHEKLMQNIRQEYPIIKRKFTYWHIAASILVVVFSVYAIWHFHPKKPVFPQETVNALLDIPPGGKRAQLILDGNDAITLDGKKNGLLAMQNKVQVIKTADGSINFKTIERERKNQTSRQNQLITPPGGKYMLTLADGTRVWLNASSRLSFPSFFTGNQRLVELEGEAYFEVAQNKSQPFVVKAKGTNVEVLGTAFNMMAYLDEAHTKTTLIEGAVRVNYKNVSKQLKPGLQAITNSFEPIRVVTADMKDALSWKDGYFYFKDEPLISIMRKLQRWYNIEVIYHPKANKHQTFGGMISSNNYISNILSIMELTDNVHFKIEGRRVMVMP